MGMTDPKLRLEAPPDKFVWWANALALATSLDPHAAERLDDLAAELKKAMGAKRLLRWTVPLLDGQPMARAWEATMGTPADGVRFTMEHVPTCYRRGRWKLFIEVFEGARHHDWGCLDGADQPTRYYHDLHNALAEAEAIAAVLLADRMERGSIEGWVKP